MLTSNVAATIPAIISDAIVHATTPIDSGIDFSDIVGPVQPVATDAKPARKPKAPKAAKPAPAPVSAPTYNVADERLAARNAVAAFYTSGTSFPFKAASAKLSDINPANAKAPSPRTAALLAAMLTYGATNIKPNGEFTRGAFLVPAKLINPNAKPGEMLHAMPESGCLGNILGRCVSHVSGPLGGKQARDGVFKLNFDAVRIELQQLGDATAKPALALLNKLAPVAKPAKRAAKA